MKVKAHSVFIADRTGDIIGGSLSKMKMCGPLLKNDDEFREGDSRAVKQIWDSPKCGTLRDCTGLTRTTLAPICIRWMEDQTFLVTSHLAPLPRLGDCCGLSLSLLNCDTLTGYQERGRKWMAVTADVSKKTEWARKQAGQGFRSPGFTLKSHHPSDL